MSPEQQGYCWAPKSSWDICFPVCNARVWHLNLLTEATSPFCFRGLLPLCLVTHPFWLIPSTVQPHSSTLSYCRTSLYTRIVLRCYDHRSPSPKCLPTCLWFCKNYIERASSIFFLYIFLCKMPQETWNLDKSMTMTCIVYRFEYICI